MKRHPTLSQLLAKINRSFENLHQESKTKMHSKHNVDPKNWPDEWRTTYYKEYPRLEKVFLPTPQLSEISLSSALLQRRSNREFLNQSVTLEQISNLLYFSLGKRNAVTEFRDDRFYPSGGARYPIETYLVSFNSELPKGVYHYNIRAHALEIVKSHLPNMNGIMQKKWMKETSFLIIMTAVFERSVMKYGTRGYRYVLQESGHIAQNLYLTSTGENLGISAVGGFLDEKLEAVINVDGTKESIVYVLTVGVEKK